MGVHEDAPEECRERDRRDTEMHFRHRRDAHATLGIGLRFSKVDPNPRM